MLIGIDGNEANVEKKVGISQYAFELLQQFYKLKKSKDYPGLSFKIYLKMPPVSSLPPAEDGWNYQIFGPRPLWTQLTLPYRLYFTNPRPDVFFSPSHYAPRFCPVPSVISIMDLAYLYYPEMFKKSDLYQLRSWTSYSANKAKKILTISDSTRFDIIKQYKTPSEKVITIYPGIKPVDDSELQTNTMEILKNKYGITGHYVLFVGTLQPRKNIARLIKAFSEIILHPKVYSDTQLVIIGKKGWLYQEILQKPKNLGIESRVKFLDFINDKELELFYKNAICFVLPSLYEGFGLPILEAMQHGCPVVTSNISSLPEAGGDAALYVDPKNIDDIARKMIMLISDEQLRAKLIAKGKKQIAKFSWEKTARQTLDILQDTVRVSKA